MNTRRKRRLDLGSLYDLGLDLLELTPRLLWELAGNSAFWLLVFLASLFVGLRACGWGA